MASEPWPPSDVGKRTSRTESPEILPRTMSPHALQPPAPPDLGRGPCARVRVGGDPGTPGADWPRGPGAWPARELGRLEVQGRLLAPRDASVVAAEFQSSAGRCCPRADSLRVSADPWARMRRPASSAHQQNPARPGSSRSDLRGSGAPGEEGESDQGDRLAADSGGS